MQIDRYRIVVVTYIGDMVNAGVLVASLCISDKDWDTQAWHTVRNGTVWITSAAYLIYYE